VYPKARLDALSDAIFGVAMTLLVLDVQLPETIHPTNATELTRALLALEAKFIPYVLSFLVLGLRWLSNIHLRSRGEMLSAKYGGWWLIYHLLVTCVPFATTIVGRFPDLAPSIWLYAGNTILISGVAFRMLNLMPEVERTDHLKDRQISLVLLMVASLLAIGWSFVSPRQAFWAFAICAGGPFISRRIGRSR
jgi:uncharacterized membrane protein